MRMRNRCEWATSDILINYHDAEWGVPVHDDFKLFEMLVLESFQAGLSWEIVLKKRDTMRLAFNDFNPHAVAKYTSKDVNRLLDNRGIIRNKRKILASVNNAKKFLDIQEEFSSFDSFIWRFVDNKTIKNNFTHASKIPSFTDISDKMSVELKKRGFSFLGSKICYAFMQSVGLVDDHTINCFRRK